MRGNSGPVGAGQERLLSLAEETGRRKTADRKGGSQSPWNKLRPEEEEKILALVRASPELSSRQLALRIIDSMGLCVSESTVYRVLKREGLIEPAEAEIVGFKASKEYHRKTKRPNELWASDCAHLKIVDGGWYYLVTVMDNFSHFICQTKTKWKCITAQLKGEIVLLPYQMSSKLEAAMRSFVGYCNYQRYREGLENVTPYDIYTGRHLEAMQETKEAKSRTLQARRGYNGAMRERRQCPLGCPLILKA